MLQLHTHCWQAHFKLFFEANRNGIILELTIY